MSRERTFLRAQDGPPGPPPPQPPGGQAAPGQAWQGYPPQGYPPQAPPPQGPPRPGPPAWQGYPPQGPPRQGQPPQGQLAPLNFRFLSASARRTIIDFSRDGNVFSRRSLLTPEGLNLWFPVAALSDRFLALVIDYTIIFALNILIFYLPLTLSEVEDDYGWVFSLSMLASFIVSNLYFIFFELRWQGRTPGKKANKLCVINRSGGELSAFAVVSRNLTRQVELWFPFALLYGLFGASSIFDVVFPIAWLIMVTLLPLWNRDRLRLGDILAGSVVIALPGEELLPDLAGAAKGEAAPTHGFTKDQLSVYGSYELHILEEILRKAEKGLTLRSVSKVAERISLRINHPLPPGTDHAGFMLFLTEFYAAERAFLEEARLYGRHKANQYTPMLQYQPAVGPPPPKARP